MEGHATKDDQPFHYFFKFTIGQKIVYYKVFRINDRILALCIHSIIKK